MKKQIEIFVESFNPERGPKIKSRLRQFAELILFKLCRMYSPSEYYLYRFNHSDMSFEKMLNYLSAKDLSRLWRPHMNNPAWAPLLENKWLSHLHFSRLGLPTTEVMGYFNSINGSTTDGHPLTNKEDVFKMLRRKKPESLVIKPVAGRGAQYISVFRQLVYSDEDIIGITAEGAEISLNELLTEREKMTISFPAQDTKYFYSGWLLEKVIKAHPFFREICPYSVPSIRVVTFVKSPREAEIHLSSIRLGRKGTGVSNASSAAIIAHVDPNGRLSQGIVKPEFGFESYHSHPDSGVPFAGKVVPMWDEVISLCKKAALATPGHRSVGWDIALSATGPLIMESNQRWSLPASQSLYVGGFLTPQRREEFRQYGMEFPAGNLSSLLSKRLLRRK